MISKLCLLGRPRVWNSAGVEIDWPKKAFLLLGRLAIAAGETEISRADLAEFLWPDSPPERARAALRTLLKRMRQGDDGHRDDVLRLGPDHISLRRDNLDCDLLETLRDLERGDAAALSRALARLDTPLLAGFASIDAAIRDWIETQRIYLLQLSAEKARKALSARIYGADARLRENLARRVLEAEPLDNDSRLALDRIERSQRRPSRAARRAATTLACGAEADAADAGRAGATERRLVVKLAGPPAELGEAIHPFVDSLLEEFERSSGKPVFASATLGEGAVAHYTLTVDARSLGYPMAPLRLISPAGNLLWAGLISAENATSPPERARLVQLIAEAMDRDDAGAWTGLSFGAATPPPTEAAGPAARASRRKI